MSALILATGIAQSSSIETILREPAFRKATRNMALAYAAVADLLSKLPVSWSAENGAVLSSVLGTSDGELDVTVQFLKIFGGSGMARPFLFQSSLHNATLGFVSERFGWRGPGATVSGYDTSGEEAMETAVDWALTMASPYAIAIGVDGLVEGKLQEGAAAVLFARPGSTALPALAKFENWKSVRGNGETLSNAFYDSNAVEQLALALGENPSTREVRRVRRDGMISCMQLGAP